MFLAVSAVAADPSSAGSGDASPAAPEPAAPAKSIWGKLGRIFGRSGDRTSGSGAEALTVADLSSDQITKGLKEALGQGLDKAVSQLGAQGGFLTNANVRIPMPERLQTVEKILRRTGQDKLADEFVATMNHAAERAVPAAAGVFKESLKKMTVADARGILQGPNNSATEYFRKAAGAQLQEKFRPIVSEATAQAGVTSAYKKFMDRASFASSLLKGDSLDLDDYVTAKAADGLFTVVADEERKIRENPAARSSELLQKVFGALRK